MISHNDNLDITASEETAAKWCMRLVDGPLTPSEQAEFETWISADDQNARLFERMIIVWQGTNAIADIPGFLALRANALDRMDQAQAEPHPVSKPSRRWMLAAVAGFAAIAIGSVNWMLAPDIYTTSVGERRSIQLADGSSVSLDAASKISVSFNDDRRSVILDHGRAKFDVAKDPLRPFSVKAGSQAVVAVGTSFSVELLQDQLRVLLYEGKVEVVPQNEANRRKLGNASYKRSAALAPGQELVAALTSGAGKIVKAGVDRASSWEDGRLDFIDIPLSKAVERFNRYSTIPIIIDDTAAGQKIVNGVFDASDPNSFIVGVTSIYDLTAIKSEDSVKIKRVKRNNNK